MKSGLVSIVMNCHNGEKYLLETIKSIFFQSYKNWEIIFIDNASTDSSRKILLNFNDRRIKYYYLSEKINLGNARNYALKKCEGEFIAFLDADDLWMEKKLELQLEQFLDSSIDMVYTNLVYYKDNKNLYSLNKILLFYRSYNPVKNILKNYNIAMSSAMVRTSILKNNKIFFDDSFNILEDRDFFTQIALLSKFRIIYEPLVKWRIHEASATNNNFELLSDELMVFYNKYRNNLPNIFNTYQNEFYCIFLKSKLRLSQFYWKKNDVLNAKKTLKPYVFSNSYILIMYLFCLMPTWLSKNLINYFNLWQLKR